MPDAEYQIVTLKRAVARHGVVCRVRSDRGRVRVDIFWRPPRVRRSMRPFLSAMPLALMRELTGKGFAGVDDVPIDGLFQTGIVAASFASGATEAAALARAVIASHGLANSDRVVAGAPRCGESGAVVEQRAWQAGCGVQTPGPLKVCECLTPSVYDAANRNRIDSCLQTVWKAIVCGGRDFLDKSLLFATLDELDVRHIIEGGATGADALAREWAQQRFRPFTEYPANWMVHGRGAGPRRNAAMLEENPDAVVAFPGGRGTDHIIALAAGRGVPIIRPQDVGLRV